MNCWFSEYETLEGFEFVDPDEDRDDDGAVDKYEGIFELGSDLTLVVVFEVVIILEHQIRILRDTLTHYGLLMHYKCEFRVIGVIEILDYVDVGLWICVGLNEELFKYIGGVFLQGLE